MEFRILGPLEALVGETNIDIGGRKQRTVLAVLLVTPGRVVSSDLLIDAVWGESPPATAGNALQVYVSQLRRAFLGAGAGESVIATRAPGYLLDLSDHDLDSITFEGLLHDAGSAEPGERAATLRASLALWRGPALADFRYDRFAEAEAARLDELRISALEQRVQADLDRGVGGSLVAELQALVAENPYRETLRGQLMVALYRAGRQAEALEAYRAAREVLVEGLGIDPGGELQRLERAILQQDEVLDAPRVPDESDGVSVRRFVSVAAIELRASDQADVELSSSLLSSARRAALRAVRSSGGTAEAPLADCVTGIFGLGPGDAIRAVGAARDAVAAADDRDGIRAAAVVASGETLTVAGGEVGIARLGGPAARAMRLIHGAADGLVLCDAATLGLAAGAIITGGPATSVDGLFAVSGLAERPPMTVANHPPLVGRGAELARLLDTGRRCAQVSESALAVVEGMAGSGKTRLAAEVCRELGSTWRVITLTLPPPGVPSEPGLRLLARTLKDGVGELARLTGGGAAGQAATVAESGEGAATAEEITWAMAQAVLGACSEGPAALVVDDAQWADDALNDVIERLTTPPAPVPLLVLVCRRPSAQPSGGPATVVLGPLDGASAEALLEWVVGDAEMSAEDRAKALASANGNSLFLTQLAIAHAQGRPFGGVPDQVRAVIQAQLDDLGADEHRVASAVSVAGPGCQVADVATLVGRDREVVENALDRVAVTGLLERRGDAVEFRHELARQSAYETATKTDRMSDHRAMAELRLVVGRVEEGARHLAIAVELQRQVSHPVDAELRARAADALEQAANARTRQGQPRAACDLLQEAVDLSDDPGVRTRRLVSLGAALEDGRPDSAAAVLDEAVAAAAALGDPQLEMRALLRRCSVEVGRGGAQPDQLAGLSRRVIAARVDLPQMYEASRLLARAQRFICCGEEEGGALRAAIEYAREAGMEAELMGATADALSLAAWGPMPVDAAAELCRVALEQFADNAWLSAAARFALVEIEALTGISDPASTAAAWAIAEELGSPHLSALGWEHCAAAARALGDHVERERWLRAGCEAGDRMCAVDLAVMLASGDGGDEAAGIIDRLMVIGPGNDLRVSTLALIARAYLVNPARAEELLAAAERSWRRADWPGVWRDLLLARGDVARRAGQLDEAKAATARAAAAFDSKLSR